MIITPIATWSCECGYSQDFDPGEFNTCPSCQKHELVQVTDPEKMIKVTTDDMSEITTE